MESLAQIVSWWIVLYSEGKSLWLSSLQVAENWTHWPNTHPLGLSLTASLDCNIVGRACFTLWSTTGQWALEQLLSLRPEFFYSASAVMWYLYNSLGHGGSAARDGRTSHEVESPVLIWVIARAYLGDPFGCQVLILFPLTIWIKVCRV